MRSYGISRNWKIPAPRSICKHPLVSVVVIALMAVLAGAGGPTAIAEWAALKEEFLFAGARLAQRDPA